MIKLIAWDGKPWFMTIYALVFVGIVVLDLATDCSLYYVASASFCAGICTISAILRWVEASGR